MNRVAVRAARDAAALEPAARVLSALLMERTGGQPRDVGDWKSVGPELLALAKRHKVVSMLPSATSFGRLGEQVQASLVRERDRAVIRNMTNLSRTVATIEALRAAGVPAIVLKGQGFSQWAYGDWSDRGASVDVDLLVPDQKIATAHETLVATGFDCITDGPRRPPLYGWLGRYNRWLHYERTYRSPELGMVDLHWRLMPGSAPWTSFDAVAAGQVMIGAGGVTVPVPGPAHSVVIAADQAEADGWPDLRCCVDVVMAWRGCSGSDLGAAASMYPRLDRVLEQAHQRIAAAGSALDDPEGHRSTSRLWRARVASGGVASAVSRAICGRFIPARRISRHHF